MIVDSHAHIFTSEGPFVNAARYRPAYDALLEDWFELWTKAGVSRGVLVQPSFLGTDNSYMVEALKRRPNLLRGVVVVTPDVEKSVLAGWDDAGVRGVRLNLIGQDALGAYASKEWMVLFSRMADLGWHLEIQCEGERIPELLALLKGTAVTMVFDHFGLPDPRAHGACSGVKAILLEATNRPVFVKLSAPYRLRGADAALYATRYLSELGAERLLWGSDWPWTNHESGRCYRSCLQSLEDWIPSAAARTTILQDTPKRLFAF